MSLKKGNSNGVKDPDANGSRSPLFEQQHSKIKDIRDSLGALPERLAIYCSDASIARHLIARNWDVKRAKKMLKESLKWRHEYKPEEIRWEEIADEAETGKIYRLDHPDKHGRSVLVMRPSRENTNSTKSQVRYLVYCMENVILNLPPDQDQMVWLIDFNGFSLSNVSIKVTRETARVLQDQYPERLALGILYNPPKFFEPFWKLVRIFLEVKTAAKVKFVYPDDPSSMQVLEGLFDMDKLEHAFGGNSQVGFNIDDYAERMREDDKRMPLFWTRKAEGSLETPEAVPVPLPFLNSNEESIKKCDSENGHGDDAQAAAAAAAVV